jgi:hypothetical protein
MHGLGPCHVGALPKHTAHLEHQEVWAGPSWFSFALKVRSLLLPGFQGPSKSVLLHSVRTSSCDQAWCWILTQHRAHCCLPVLLPAHVFEERIPGLT